MGTTLTKIKNQRLKRRIRKGRAPPPPVELIENQLARLVELPCGSVADEYLWPPVALYNRADHQNVFPSPRAQLLPCSLALPADTLARVIKAVASKVPSLIDRMAGEAPAGGDGETMSQQRLEAGACAVLLDRAARRYGHALAIQAILDYWLIVEPNDPYEHVAADYGMSFSASWRLRTPHRLSRRRVLEKAVINCCYNGDAVALTCILEHEITVIDINARVGSETALHRATEQGHSSCVAVLLDHGADPNLLTLDRKTAAQIAASWGYYWPLAYLVYHGSDLDHCTPQFRSTRSYTTSSTAVRQCVARALFLRCQHMDAVVAATQEALQGPSNGFAMPTDIVNTVLSFISSPGALGEPSAASKPRSATAAVGSDAAAAAPIQPARARLGRRSSSSILLSAFEAADLSPQDRERALSAASRMASSLGSTGRHLSLTMADLCPTDDRRPGELIAVTGSQWDPVIEVAPAKPRSSLSRRLVGLWDAGDDGEERDPERRTRNSRRNSLPERRA